MSSGSAAVQALRRTWAIYGRRVCMCGGGGVGEGGECSPLPSPPLLSSPLLSSPLLSSRNHPEASVRLLKTETRVLPRRLDDSFVRSYLRARIGATGGRRPPFPARVEGLLAPEPNVRGGYTPTTRVDDSTILRLMTCTTQWDEMRQNKVNPRVYLLYRYIHIQQEIRPTIRGGFPLPLLPVPLPSPSHP